MKYLFEEFRTAGIISAYSLLSNHCSCCNLKHSINDNPSSLWIREIDNKLSYLTMTWNQHGIQTRDLGPAGVHYDFVKNNWTFVYMINNEVFHRDDFIKRYEMIFLKEYDGPELKTLNDLSFIPNMSSWFVNNQEFFFSVIKPEMINQGLHKRLPMEFLL